MNSLMTSASTSHFVFVDFENVPNIDLTSIGEKSVMVTLLIGKTQKKLDLELVQQIHRHAARIQLVEVGASGRNALDLTLAFYLGRAVEQSPDAHFHIVSKDKDFDPLISHLRKNKIHIFRHDTFAALPFLPQPKKNLSIENPSEPVVDKLAKLIVHLQTKTKARPTRRKTLNTHINNFCGNLLSDEELAEIIHELVARDILKIDGRDKVTY